MLLFTILLSILVVLSQALPVEKYQTSRKGVHVGFTVSRYASSQRNITAVRGNVRAASDSGISVPLRNEYSMYNAEITLGTPPQTLQVDLDTGSSDLWVPGSATQSDYGTFNPNRSSTYQKVTSGFDIQYGDGTTASGDWAADVFGIGGLRVTNLVFGYASRQTAGEGILGIGLQANEASIARNSAEIFAYDNLPILLKKQGIIDTTSYSLYLNSADADTGSLIFGGIDSTKYSDDLEYFDLVNIDDAGDSTSSPVAFFINLDGLSTSSVSITDTYPALLDSGTTLVYAPQKVAQAIGEKYGTYNSYQQAYTVNCNATGDDFIYTFGSKTITVPFSNVVFNVDNYGYECILGIMPNSKDFYILGDGFLRSAYVYYDLDKPQIGLAQASYA